MDKSDAADLAAVNQTLKTLNQTLDQTLAHVDVTSVANHALYNGIVFWAVIGAVVVTTVYLRHRTRMAHIRLLQTFAEKGLPIPPELLTADSKANPVKTNPIARGVVLISVGLAIILFLWSITSGYFGDKDPDTWMPFLGVFPLFIGIAYLGIGLHQRRHG